MRLPSMPRTLRHLGPYMLSGGTSAVVDIALYTRLHAMGATVPVAATAGFCVAALLNYTLASRFVFRQPMAAQRLGGFLAVALLGMTINVGVTSTLALALGAWRAAAKAAELGVGPWVVDVTAKAAGIGAAFVLNFWLNTTIVFREPARP